MTRDQRSEWDEIQGKRKIPKWKQKELDAMNNRRDRK